MGYTASGNGSATLRKNINKEELTSKLNEIVNKYKGNLSHELEYSIDGDNIEIYEWSDHWDETNIMEFLDMLTPYITEGDMFYSGDEDENWKYSLVGNEWVDQNGVIYYSTQEMIDALEGQGYKVTKK